MREEGKCIIWVLDVTVIVLLTFGEKASANDVLTYLYDGGLGNANPVSQGWTGTLFDVTGQSSLTPDPLNDRVTVIAGPNGEAGYGLSGQLNVLANAVSDDFYAWELTLEVNSDTTHQLSQLDLITGTASGSVGYRDRIFFETTANVGVNRIRLVDLTADAGWPGPDPDKPHPALHPGDTPNWTTLFAPNTYRFERNGNAVNFFVNGDKAFQGIGGTSSIASTQLHIADNATGLEDINWYSFAVGVPATPPPPPPGFGTQWVRSHPIHIAGTVDATGFTAEDVTTYADFWNASGADVYPTGADHITNWFEPNGLPWTLWISPGKEGPDGVFQQSEVGVPAHLPGRIGYQIGGEPRTQTETDEVIATAAALKAYDPNGLVYVGLNSDPTNAMVNQMLSDPNLDALIGHRYDSDNGTYADLQRYRAFGLAHNKPYFRFVRSHKIRPTEFREPYDLSNSDLRFKTFSALTYGYTGIVWFFYNLEERHLLDPQLFSTTETYDLALRKTPQFEFTAGLNKELANVGNMITQLRSTDVRLHLGDSSPYSQPASTFDWSIGAGGDPYITNIDQLVNDDVDILTGYFLDDHNIEHFMIQNTLHSHGDNPGTAAGVIRVEFDFSSVIDPTFDTTRIRRLSRNTGFWEDISLVADGSDRYHVDLVLAAGDADLFRYVAFEPIVADLDFSGTIDVNDIDKLRQVIMDGSTHPIYDLNFDGVVDAGDLSYQIETILETAFGDANLDFKVDANDLAIARQNFGLDGGWAAANFNLDGSVDANDLAQIRRNSGVFGPAASVPEPAGLLMLALLGIRGVTVQRHALKNG